MSDHRGRFVWYELMTPDPQASLKFYAEVVGWKAHVMPMEGMEGGYSMLGAGDGPETSVGGVAKVGDDPACAGAPPHWLGYVAVPDVDEAAKKVASLGGAVRVPPADIPTVGRFSVVADPQGATFSLFKGIQEMPEPAGMPTDRQFSWNELLTSDHEAAWKFYSEMFPWTVSDRIDMGPMGTYLIFARNGAAIGGMMTKPKEATMPSAWMYYTRIPDLDAAVAKAKAAGGTLCNGPMEVPGGDRVAQLTDLHGVLFGLHEVKKA